MKNTLTEGKVGQRLFHFLLPILAGNVLQQLYNSADAVILGHYAGETALGSIGACHPIYAIIISLLIGLSSGGEILIGRAVGARDQEAVRVTVDTVFTSIMGLSVVLGVIGYFCSGALLGLLGTPEEFMSQGTLYLQIISLGIPAIAGYSALGGMIRATGNSKIPLVFLAVASVLNIALDILAVAVLGMGADGVALATVAAQAVSFLLCWIYTNRAKNAALRYDPLHLTFSLPVLREGVRFGVPASIQIGASSVAMLLLQTVVNGMGAQAVTAFTVGSKIDSFAALPITNIGQAMSIFTSQNLSAGRRDRVDEAYKLSHRWAYAISVFLLLLLWGAGEPLVRFFGASDPTTVRMAQDYIRILSVGYFMASYYIVAHGLIRGSGNTLAPMLITILGHWIIRLPVAALGGQAFGYRGVWSSILVSWLFCFVTTWIYYRSKKFQSSLETWDNKGDKDHV